MQIEETTLIVSEKSIWMLMKRRIIYGLLAILLTANVVVGARVYFRSAQAAEKDSAYPSLELFSYVMEKVRKDYVDGKKVTYQELVYGALKGMINTLDPHSEFMEPAKYDELQKDTQGAFGGLGIMIEMRDNNVVVVAPMDGTPGFKAGILPGDRIMKIDGKSADKMGLQEAVQHLRGEPNTEVAVTILRPSTGQTKEMKLTRAIIKVDMVTDINNKKDFPLGEDKVGYVRLTQFGEKTSEDLEKALKKLKAQGMQGFILDLRWNPGGLLDQAVEVCEKFLPRGQLVVSTEGQNSSQNSVRRANGRGDELNGMPMVILVNLNSASASEIVAGCLQDLHRAQIMGEKTFGKGSVQSILPLQDGSALRLTTAKYYTPSHKVIHGEGITPDCPVPMAIEDEAMVYLLKRRPGLETLDEKDRQQIKSVHDVQLERAQDLLKGILIYTHRTPENQKLAGKPDKVAKK
ncbi:MAG: Carboxyl-terminal protease [Pedosphaera sp.]|nr:Carboxyl-terminal protease [Pedosphaera sp.]